jgi:methionyl-tRNA formyltransferase
MRIAFAGTPPFAAAALAALLQAGYPVPLVLTQPDRPAGRGQRLAPGAVRQLADTHGLTVRTPLSLRPERGGEQAHQALHDLRTAAPDLLVVAAYGLLLPQEVLDIPAGLPLQDGSRLTALNIHASLLPRWRGAAPVVRAIDAGDRSTGVTLMQMDAGLDTGPMVCSRTLDIAADQTGGSLTAVLAQMGAQLLLDTLAQAARGPLAAVPQPAAGVSHAPKLSKAESWLDWSRAAPRLADRIRAFDPFPGAGAVLGGQVLRLWAARALEGPPEAAAAAPHGTIREAGAAGLRVVCGSGELLVTELQRPGGRRLPAREFLAGMPIAAGSRFEAPAEAPPEAPPAP